MRRTGFAIVVVTLGAAALATWLFPRALPTLALEQRITRDAARVRADSFISRHDLAPDSARRAILFDSDDTLNVFVELNAGRDSLNAMLRDREVSVYGWTVRAFTPGEEDEVRVRLSPDGRVLAFTRTLSDSLSRPDPGDSVARSMADTVLRDWMGESLERWRLASSSYESVNPSRRTDRTYVFERVDRTIATAPIRMDIVLAGDLPRQARPYVAVPEAFLRRYGEMRSSNDFLALLATLGMLVIVVAGVAGVRRQSQRGIRWAGPAWVGGVIGVLTAAGGFNALGISWMFYDTATPEAFHLMLGTVGALGGGALTALVVAVALAAAEVLARTAFPWHVDWWKLWRFRGTATVAGQVGGGYAAAAIGFCYIAAFYLLTRTLLGWWVPTSVIDDPNLIATPLPWVGALASSLNAAVWEEAIFRALPLSLIAIATQGRDDRERWMALGVVATSLVFGFAHSNYPSWPAYSRGIEIFLEACLWAVLFLRFGLLVPVLAHFFYDLVLFGMFAAAGDSAAYRVSAAVVIAFIAFPAVAVLVARLRQGQWQVLPDEARFAAWMAAPDAAPPEATRPPVQPAVGTRARAIALGCLAVAVAVMAVAPSRPVVGAAWTAGPGAAIVLADSVFRTRGEDPATWRRLVRPQSDSNTLWRPFLARHEAESLGVSLGSTYAIPASWQVRYVHGEGDLQHRAAEWRVRVLPDGRLLDVRRLLPDSAPRAAIAADSVRALARAALASLGSPADLVEREFDVQQRPNREDVVVTYADTAVALPGDAEARVRVTVAGDEVLSAARFIHIPEAFAREHRRLTTRDMIMVVPLVFLLAGIVLTAVVRTMRKRTPVAPPVPTTTVRRLLAILLAALIVETVLSVPSALAGYDTAQAWSSFVGTQVTLWVMGLALVLFLLAAWSLVNGLRRRLDIPLVSSGGMGQPWSNDLVLGLGLGAVSPLLGTIGTWLMPGEWTGPPGTRLDSLSPLFSMLPDLVTNVAAMIPVLAIPALAIVGALPTTRQRLALVAFLAAVVGAIGLLAGGAQAGQVDPARSIWGAVTFAAQVAVLWAWGGTSVTTWIVAALTQSMAGGWRQVFHATTPVEQAAAALMLVVGIGVVLWIERGIRRRTEGPAAITPA